VKNKAVSLCDFILSNQIDLFAITETWLVDELDKFVLSELVPNGYDVQHVPRGKRKGGGVAIVHSNAIKLKPTPQHTAYTHFEFMTRTVSANNHHFHLCVVYRPPPSKGNQYKTSTFFEEWSEFLNNFVITQGELLITGDLNFHLEFLYNMLELVRLKSLQDFVKEQNLINH
jgi:exonuclease III